MVKFRDPTHSVVFWIFHLTNFVFLGCMFGLYFFLKTENTFDLVMAEIFVFTGLFTFVGSKVGGYLGAVMEEDTCGEMDMGVLSTIGGFIGATVSALIGGALAGLYFFLPAHYLHAVVATTVIFLFCLSCLFDFQVKRLVPRVRCCDGEQPRELAMKNKVSVLLFLAVLVEVVLCVVMVVVMKRDLANQWMLGGMMYGMGGAMIGGLLGGWIAGLLDKHEGPADCDNPIMVCGMSLMGGMMGGMLAGMIGGMNALMGAGTIVPTLVLPILLVGFFYVWMYRGKFQLEVTPRAKSKLRFKPEAIHGRTADSVH